MCCKECVYGRVEGYYESLSAAVAAVNAGVIDVSGVRGELDRVKVWVDGAGQKGIVLLEDVTESVAVEIVTDMELELAGKAISFTGEGCLRFGEGTDCVIRGEVSGSGIRRSLAGEESTAYVIQAAGERLRLEGGSYEAEGYHADGLRGVVAAEGCGCLEVVGCSVSAVNGEDETATSTRAVQSQAVRTVIQDAVLTSQAGGLAQGVLGAGEVVIERSQVVTGSSGSTARAIRQISGSVYIRESEISGVAEDGTAEAVRGTGELVRIEGSVLSASSETDQALAVYGGEGAVEIVGGRVEASSTGGEAYAVYNTTGTVKVEGAAVAAGSEAANACAFHNISGVVEVVDSAVEAGSQTAIADGIWNASGTVAVVGGNIETSSQEVNAYAIYSAGGVVTVDGVDIHAITYGEDDGSAYGISLSTGGILRVRDSHILADAKGVSAVAGPLAIAITNNGTAFLENVELNGTHSGVQNGGGAKLYVSGGRYTGYCHGGFYFAHGPEGEAFVNDVTTRGGYYEGIFDYSELEDTRYSSMYIGGGSGVNSSNMVAYMDGCRFDGTQTNSSIAVRGSSGEQNNTLNVSNCTLVDTRKWVRVDNDTLRINIGMGTNITAENLKNQDNDGNYVDYVGRGRAAFTGWSYRRHHAEHICDGKDYEALKAFLESKIEGQ